MSNSPDPTPERRAPTRRQVLLGGGALLLSVLASAFLGSHLTGHDGYDDLANWLAATATVLAFLAASYAAVYASRTLAIESARDARMLDQQEREQASLVAAWYRSVRVAGEVASPPRFEVVNLSIRNASPVPVTDVRVAVELMWNSQHIAAGDEYFDVIAPGGEPREFAVPMEMQSPCTEEELQQVIDDGDVMVAISFRDSTGMRWARSPIGLLEPLGRDPE